MSRRDYLDGVADGFVASADLADKLREHYTATEARAALGMIMDALRETSAVWRDKAIKEGDKR